MSDLVGNSEDQFSHKEAHIWMAQCGIFFINVNEQITFSYLEKNLLFLSFFSFCLNKTKFYYF